MLLSTIYYRSLNLIIIRCLELIFEKTFGSHYIKTLYVLSLNGINKHFETLFSVKAHPVCPSQRIMH